MVAPLWDDLSGAVTGAASYLTTGIPGSRVFTFEWLNWKWNHPVASYTCPSSIAGQLPPGLFPGV